MLQTTILDFNLHDFHVVNLTGRSAIIIYTAESHGEQNGNTSFTKVSVTSTWAKRK